MLENYLNQAKNLGTIVDKSILWLKGQKKLYDHLNTVLLGFNELPWAIRTFGGVGDDCVDIPTGYHLLSEAEQELNAALLLAISGFYKDSIRSTRCFLELYIFGLFNLINKDNHYYKSWINENEYTPKFTKLIKSLSEKSKNISAINERLGWGGEIDELYDALSGFVHTRGARHTHTALRLSNINTFDKDGLESSLKFVIKAIQVNSTGFIAIFPMALRPVPLFEKFAFNPPISGFLEESQVDKIRHIFSSDSYKALSDICDSDSEASELVDMISSQRDLSEEDIIKSFQDVINSEPVSQQKDEILLKIKQGKQEEAFALVTAIQRSFGMAAMTILFNPFYKGLNKNDGHE